MRDGGAAFDVEEVRVDRGQLAHLSGPSARIPPDLYWICSTDK
jgi:hypothetical protein